MRDARPRQGQERCGARELWAHADLRQRSTAVAAAVLLVVLAALASLEPAALPAAAAVLSAVGVLLVRFRTGVQHRCRAERRISEQAARGQAELERWLASGEHA